MFTEYVYGAVVFIGHDTMVIQNSTDPPSKRSRIQRKMDKIIYLMYGVVFLMSFIGSIVFGIETREDIVRNGGRTERRYLRPGNVGIFFDPDRAPIYQFNGVYQRFNSGNSLWTWTEVERSIGMKSNSSNLVDLYYLLFG